MRQISTHKVNGCNEAIGLTADDRDENNGNTSHCYTVRWWESAYGVNKDEELVLQFQRGPIKEAGVNGITNEVLLAILIDRLKGFQTSQWYCDENQQALLGLMRARDAMFARTAKRTERGVEGTHELMSTSNGETQAGGLAAPPGPGVDSGLQHLQDASATPEDSEGAPASPLDYGHVEVMGGRRVTIIGGPPPGDDRCMPVHFPLRPTHSVTFRVPTDLTDAEAERLAAFIRALPFK